MDMTNIDTGDQVFGRRRRSDGTSDERRRRAVMHSDAEDTEGHVAGDQVFERRPVTRRGTEPIGVEDTEGHVAGDQVFERRPVTRRGTEPEGVADADDTEDTEGHVHRTYPSVTADDGLDCRMPLPGDEDQRKRRL